MKKFVLALVTLLSVSSFAQSQFADRGGLGAYSRGVECKITTSNYNTYYGYGRSCRQAQDDVIDECIYEQKRRGVANWDRCAHAIRPGKRYTMSCSDYCGYPPYLN